MATDWRTTVALVATLGTLGIAGLGTGATTALGVGRAGIVKGAAAGRLGSITSTAFQGTKSKFIQRAIIGKPAISATDKLFKAGANFAANPKTKALTTSLLAKAGMSVGVAFLVAGAATTYPFARFELAEAVDKIGIAIFTAAGAGDVEEVRRLQEILEELVDPRLKRRKEEEREG